MYLDLFGLCICVQGLNPGTNSVPSQMVGAESKSHDLEKQVKQAAQVTYILHTTSVCNAGCLQKIFILNPLEVVELLGTQNLDV